MLSGVTLDWSLDGWHWMLRLLFSSVRNVSSHSIRVSQSSQVSWIALWGCSLNVFVIDFAFVFVFLLISSCLQITSNVTSMSPHLFDQISQRSQGFWRYLGSLNDGVFFVFVSVFLLVRVCLLISLITHFCLKGDNYLLRVLLLYGSDSQ